MKNTHCVLKTSGVWCGCHDDVMDVNCCYCSVSEYLMGDIDNYPLLGKTKVSGLLFISLDVAPVCDNCLSVQGFMQGKIIASHTCFGGHMDVNC